MRFWVMRPVLETWKSVVVALAVAVAGDGRACGGGRGGLGDGGLGEARVARELGVDAVDQAPIRLARTQDVLKYVHGDASSVVRHLCFLCELPLLRAFVHAQSKYKTATALHTYRTRFFMPRGPGRFAVAPCHAPLFTH